MGFAIIFLFAKSFQGNSSGKWNRIQNCENFPLPSRCHQIVSKAEKAPNCNQLPPAHYHDRCDRLASRQAKLYMRTHDAPAANVAVDKVARNRSSLHPCIAEIASLGARDTCLAGIAVSLLGESCWIDNHSFDEFLDLLKVPGAQMSKTTMPNVVRKRLWLRIDWFPSDRLERVDFVSAVDRLEPPKLAVWDRFGDNVTAEQNIGPFGRLYVDFQPFAQQDVRILNLDSASALRFDSLALFGFNLPCQCHQWIQSKGVQGTKRSVKPV